MDRVAYHIESIGSYRDHKADIGIAIKMTDECYFNDTFIMILTSIELLYRDMHKAYL